MGGAKEAWMAQQEADALAEELETLIGEGELEEGTASYGVAKQIIGRGIETLSEKQRVLFDGLIRDRLDRAARDREIARLVNNDNF